MTTPVYLCRKCKRSECLRDFLEHAGVEVLPVRCQKLCEGPVVGLEVGGRMEWFERVDKAKPMVAVVCLATDHRDDLPKALEKRRQAKYRGRAPR